MQYPKCTTCKKAKNWLDENNIKYTDRNIKESNPTESELREWHKISGLAIKKFFNTSGIIYREQGLSKKLATMTEDEQFKLLSSDGMLVKRPIIVGKDKVLLGFKEETWESLKNN
jgi:arsenate reductase (glutaredoxin)